MISELIGRLKTWLREIVAAAKAHVAALTREQKSTAVQMIHELIVASSAGNVLHVGKRYKKTSGHAPIFSLYTFFARRQVNA